MNAGILQHNIRIEKPEIQVNEEFGSQNEIWVLYANTKAAVNIDSSNRTVDNNEVFFTESLTFRIRYYHKVDEKMRIIWNNKKYRILSVIPDRIKQCISLKTELINE